MLQTIIQKSLHESDFVLWTQDTVAKLKAKDFDQLDLENLIEDIEALGRSERQELENRLETLLAHLLKRIYVSMPDCFNGWENTIREQRRRIFLKLKNTPSLKSYWDQSFEDAWFLALGTVNDEHDPKGYHFPEVWPFESTIDAMLNTDFWE